MFEREADIYIYLHTASRASAAAGCYIAVLIMCLCNYLNVRIEGACVLLKAAVSYVKDLRMCLVRYTWYTLDMPRHLPGYDQCKQGWFPCTTEDVPY